MFIYSESSGIDLSYSINVLLDHYPLSALRMCNESDENLISLYISGVDEIDLENLSKYPNLRNVIIASNVKRIYGKLDDVKHMENKIIASYYSERNTPLKITCQSTNTILLGIKENTM